MTLPIANCKRIISEAGASRVSDDAAKQLSTYLYDIGSNISETAIQYAKHAGRKTVKLDDIQLAAETIMG